MERINQLVKNYISPLLKEHKFKKKKNSWNRCRNNIIDVIELQELPGSIVENERFVINIGLFIPEFYEYVWDKPTDIFVKEVDSIVRYRLGDLVKVKNYKKYEISSYFELNNNSDIMEIGMMLQELFKEVVFPFFELLEDYKLINNFIENTDFIQKEYPLNQIYFAFLNKSLGNKKRAINILDDVISTSTIGWINHAKKAKKRIEATI